MYMYIKKYKFWDCIFTCRQRLGYTVSIDLAVVFQDFWFGDAGGQDETTAGSAPETPQGRIRQEGQTRGKSAIALFHCAQLCYSVANCKSNKAVSVGQYWCGYDSEL